MRRLALVAAAVIVMLTSASAQNVGTEPPAGSSFIMPDGTWLRGLAAGINFHFRNGVIAHAGGTAASATQLLPGNMITEVDTVATSGDSVALPQCSAPMVILMRNAGVGTLDVYADPTANSLTGSVDTINATAGSTAYTLATNTNAIFFCAKNGSWSAIKGS